MHSRTTRLLAIAFVAFTNCTSKEADVAPSSTCQPESVDRFKELLVVDDSVVNDPRALNGSDGTWSFRSIVERLAPPGVDAGDMVNDWLESFEHDQKVNTFVVPARANLVSNVCSWWKATPSNGCDVDCKACAARKIDLASAPFRLIAIANRLDIHENKPTPDGIGELRFVFALTRGPADDPASQPLNMSIGFEFKMPSSEGRNAQYWANRWHALASFATFDESYKQAMEALSRDVVSGPTLAQLRTNERAFDWLWELREYKLGEKGFDLAPTENTPSEQFNDSPMLQSFIEDNQQQIANDSHVLPPAMTGGAAHAQIIWRSAVPEKLRKDFAKNTCNGCHSSEQTPVDANFHVSPFKTGTARVSPFLNNPAAPTTDELARRESVMQRALCGAEN